MDEFREFHLPNGAPTILRRSAIAGVYPGRPDGTRISFGNPDDDGDWVVTESYAEVRAWLLGGERKAAVPQQIAAAHHQSCETHPMALGWQRFQAGVRWAERHHGIGGGE